MEEGCFVSLACAEHCSMYQVAESFFHASRVACSNNAVLEFSEQPPGNGEGYEGEP